MSVIDYSVLMGQTSHLAPESFAARLNAYLWHLVEPLGAKKSGRWMVTATKGARKKDYWEGILKNEKSMTANDIQVVAEVLLDISPFQFIRDARNWEPHAECGSDTLPSEEDGLSPTQGMPVEPEPEPESNVIVGGFGKNTDIVIPENVEDEWAGQYAADPADDDPIDHGTP